MDELDDLIPTQFSIYECVIICVGMPYQRPSKRQRIYRACDQCRRRKSKCDGTQPTCSICSSANRTCTYETGGGRRGLPSGYVRSLEVLLGLVIQHVPNSEGTLHGILRNSSAKGGLLTSKSANRSLATWRKSKLSRKVSQILEPDLDGLAFDESEWEPVESRDDDVDMDSSCAALPDIESSEETTAVRHSPQVVVDKQSLTVAPFIYPAIPENTPDLLDSYFTHTHCWFPVLERRDLLRAMHIGSSIKPEEASCQTLLWSVITYELTRQCTWHQELPTAAAMQTSILQQVLGDWNDLRLGHAQATLLFALMHISMGSISQAWLLLAQATRMLVALPTSEKGGRFRHTYNGCAQLDAILSASLNRTPCLSPHEILEHGEVDEDDVEEWDLWPTRTSPNGRRRTPTALRALSIFNCNSHLTQELSQILHSPPNSISIEDLLSHLREREATITHNHPNDKHTTPSPPLLMLHLTMTFSTLSLIRRAEPVSPAIKELCIKNIHHTLDILDRYQEISAPAPLSPLVYCFALQCQRCLKISSSELSSTAKEVLQQRISTFLQPLHKTSQQPNAFVPGLSPGSLNLGNALETITPHQTTNMEDLNAVNESMLHSQSQLEPSVMDFPDLPPTDGITSPTGPGEGYDALIEEIVTTFPSNRYVRDLQSRFGLALMVYREEPMFAHNLGFYDGHLDMDFLAQLQQSP